MASKILPFLHPEYLPFVRIYSEGIPSFFEPFFDSPALLRLKGVGQNCGTEFSKMYSYRAAYSRLDHSLGVALIVWNFSKDPKAALAGLFHDISHTAFSHVGDFLLGDAENQESAELHTRSILENDSVIPAELAKLGLTVADVEDYSRFPIADNPGPKLSADRLEYTLSSARSLNFKTLDEIRSLYGSLVAVTTEDEAIAFDDAEKAEEFALLSVQNDAGCFSSYESVSAMSFLAAILKRLSEVGGIAPMELYVLQDADFIERIKRSDDEKLRKMWAFFENMETYKILRYPRETDTFVVSTKCKRRFIDPLVSVAGKGHPLRVSEYSEAFKKARDYHLGRQEEWIVLNYRH